MPWILDFCREAKTLRAFLDAPETADPALGSLPADTAAHLLSGCPSCLQHLEASLSQPGLRPRITAALCALDPDHTSFFPLYFADRSEQLAPPPEMEHVDEWETAFHRREGQRTASRSKTEYIDTLEAYGRSLAARPLFKKEHFALAQVLHSHVVVDLPFSRWKLDRDELRRAFESSALAAWEASFRLRDEVRTAHYDKMLDTMLSMEHSDAICESAVSLAVVEEWREGRIEQATEKVEDELIRADMIPAWHRLWRASLFYLLTGDPEAAVRVPDLLQAESAERSEGAERRFSALEILLRASLIADNEPAEAGRLG